MSRYKDLLVWQKSMDLTRSVYHLTCHFSSDEKYGLISQMRRAAISVASNIAEGSNRGPKEFSRYIDIARGSLAELDTQVIISEEWQAVHFHTETAKKNLATTKALIEEVGRMTSGLQKKLKTQNSELGT